MSKIARIGMVTLDKSDCQNWQLWTPELATLDKCSLFYTEIDVKDCQNWQLWTSAVFSIERRVSKIARNGGNFGQVQSSFYREIDAKDCRYWQKSLN